MLYEFQLQTPKENFYNITRQVREAVEKSGVENVIAKPNVLRKVIWVDNG